MNPNYQEFRFPQIRAHPWGGVFKPRTPPESIELVGRMLAYVPENRCRALEVLYFNSDYYHIIILYYVQACGHTFFDEIREENAMQPNGTPIPDYYFQLTPEETANAPHMVSVLIPPHKLAVSRATEHIYASRDPEINSNNLLEEGRGELKGAV